VLMLKRATFASIAFKTLIEIEKDFKRLVSLEARDRKKFKGVLMMTQPSKPYSATVASTIHSKGEYYSIRNRLMDEDLWTDELEKLHVDSLNIALPIRSRN
ncbi:MAG: HNH endonuclease, partial [Acinetobacter oleivorans]|nr:HNH endonuclease [Acinetobacter oleivorans]